MSGSESKDERNLVGNNTKETCSALCRAKKSRNLTTTNSISSGEKLEEASSHVSGHIEVKVPKTVEDELSNFRQLWQKDISLNLNQNKPDEVSVIVDKENNEEEEEKEKKAKIWFLKGIEFEKNGQLIEAIRYYRKAVQLEPDIEFKLCDTLGNSQRELSGNDNFNEIIDNNYYPERLIDDNDEFEESEDENIDLLLKLQRFVTKSKAICCPARPQTTTHISSLPIEIILYILRWVVSHDLDLRSLEMCSMVSRGFYICARDQEIWRLACLKIWGMNCGNLKNYDSWRTMYLKRPHLNYNGCYISKTTYIRHGETSFQDQFYRPWHVVEYYRYFRFFPEGVVYMLTTPDQPAPVTCILRTRENRHPSLLTGHYRLQDDRIFIVLQREDLINNKFRKRKNNVPLDLIEQTFHIELQVVNRKNRINNCLIWKRYCVTSLRGQTETKTSFEVMSNKFPCLWFSRVKSYTVESERPLL